VKYTVSNFFGVLFVVLLISCENPESLVDLRIQTIHLDSLSQVIPVTDSVVVPVLYDTLLINNLSSITEKKQQFIDQILPSILIVKFQHQLNYDKIDRIIRKKSVKEKVSKKEQSLLDSLMIKYDALTPNDLLVQLKEHPTSLILAQAALESGWGQSRFALEGYNLFGITTVSSYLNSQKLLSINSGHKKIFMKKYENVYESVDHYLLTIGKSNAYKKLRNKRFEEGDVYELINELNKYSINTDYKKMLKQVIIWNDLERYDKCKIDARYIYKRGSLCYIFKQFCEGTIPDYLFEN